MEYSQFFLFPTTIKGANIKPSNNTVLDVKNHDIFLFSVFLFTIILANGYII